jgi:bifunctional DNase/RNase
MRRLALLALVSAPLTTLVLGPSTAVAGRSSDMKPPRDSVPLAVEKVAPAGENRHIVFLTDAEHDRILPIDVGLSEAIAIDSRLNDRSYGRPLTYDLMDDAIRGLGGDVVQVHIHSLDDGIFRARVSVRQKRRLLHLEARASDGIALALARDLPVWMDTTLYTSTAVSMEELLDTMKRMDQPTALEHP